MHRMTILGAELGEFCLRAEVDKPAIEAVMVLLADLDVVDLLAIDGIDDDEAAVLGLVAPSGRHVDALAVGRDARSVSAHFEFRFPHRLFDLWIRNH